LPPNDYLIFRRSLELVTLDGKRVKSNGEKFIADFLFEHGIEYRYERPWAWKADFLDGSVYRPDFSIVHGGYDYILEHWAIEPENPTSRACQGIGPPQRPSTGRRSRQSGRFGMGTPWNCLKRTPECFVKVGLRLKSN
jgi:hypothetical protein